MESKKPTSAPKAKKLPKKKDWSTKLITVSKHKGLKFPTFDVLEQIPEKDVEKFLKDNGHEDQIEQWRNRSQPIV